MPTPHKRAGKLQPPTRSPQDIATDRLFLGDDAEWPIFPVLGVKNSRETGLERVQVAGRPSGL